jgi:hypothetical protein
MAQKGLILRALIASPSDVQDERKVVTDVISVWNATHSHARAAIIEPVKWESHSVPRQGNRPQAIINEQLGGKCDFLIGMFWTRLGKETGVAASGTVEEIQEFLNAGKPCLLYFSNQPVQPGSIDQDQYAKLGKFKAEMREKGLQLDYGEVAEFREQLGRHLNAVVNEILEAYDWSSDRVESVTFTEFALADEFDMFVKRVSGLWIAERDSDPLGDDDGKSILDAMRMELIDFASRPDVTDEFRQTSQAIALKTRKLQRHETFCDGGDSFQKFWDDGDAIMDEIGRLGALLSAPQESGV